MSVQHAVLFDIAVLLGDSLSVPVAEFLPVLGQLAIDGYQPIALVDTRIFEDREQYAITMHMLVSFAAAVRTPLTVVTETAEQASASPPPLPVMKLARNASDEHQFDRASSYLVVGESRQPCPAGTQRIQLIRLRDCPGIQKVGAFPNILDAVASLGERTSVV